MIIYKVFTLNAAHRLPNVPSGHKCGRIHGHSFRIEVHIDGAVGDQTGWVVDYADIQQAFQPIHDLLDHNFLNDIDGLENPTSENIARWVWPRLQPELPNLTTIIVQESPDSGCVYHGEE